MKSFRTPVFVLMLGSAARRQAREERKTIEQIASVPEPAARDRRFLVVSMPSFLLSAAQLR
jgi:hypothetical protein